MKSKLEVLGKVSASVESEIVQEQIRELLITIKRSVGEATFNAITSSQDRVQPLGGSMIGMMASRIQHQVDSELHKNLIGKDRSSNVFLALQAMKQEITNASRQGDSDTQHKLSDSFDRLDFIITQQIDDMREEFKKL